MMLFEQKTLKSINNLKCMLHGYPSFNIIFISQQKVKKFNCVVDGLNIK